MCLMWITLIFLTFRYTYGQPVKGEAKIIVQLKPYGVYDAGSYKQKIFTKQVLSLKPGNLDDSIPFRAYQDSNTWLSQTWTCAKHSGWCNFSWPTAHVTHSVWLMIIFHLHRGHYLVTGINKTGDNLSDAVLLTVSFCRGTSDFQLFIQYPNRTLEAFCWHCPHNEF